MVVKELFARLGFQVDKRSLGGAERAMAGVQRGLMAIGAGIGFAKLIRHTIGFNKELQETEMGFATIFQGLQHIDRAAATSKARELIAGLREDAAKGAGNFNDMKEAAFSIAPALVQAGGTADQLRELSSQVVVGAKAFGENSKMAAFDIKQALTKGVSVRDRFANILLGMEGIEREDFNKLSVEKRLEVLNSALTSGAMQDAKAEYEKSFTGILDGLEGIAIEFGRVIGKPMIESLTPLLKEAGEWLEANKEEVAKFAKAIGKGFGTAIKLTGKLVKGFVNLAKTSKIFQTVLTALGIGLVVVATKAAAAWALAALPFLLIIAALGALYLLIEDLVVWINGGDSALKELFQRWKAGIKEWLEAPSDIWLVNVMKGLIRDAMWFLSLIKKAAKLVGSTASKVAEVANLLPGGSLVTSVIGESPLQKAARRFEAAKKPAERTLPGGTTTAQGDTNTKNVQQTNYVTINAGNSDAAKVMDEFNKFLRESEAGITQ